MLEKLGTRDTRLGSCQGDVGIMNWLMVRRSTASNIHYIFSRFPSHL